MVVKDVHLAVGAGEVVGLLGPNGAGKTTTFYMVVGLVRADAGEIRIDGQPVHDAADPPRSRLGLSLPAAGGVDLPQADGRGEHPRRARAAARTPTAGALKTARDRRAAGRACCDDLSIDKLRDSPAPALSGGERRRVEIARALATQPRFILLDEPFAGVDPIAVIEIQRIIGFLRARGIGVLITDHNVRETLGICDRAYIISEGSVLAEGTPHRDRRQRRGAQGLPRRTLPDVMRSCRCAPRPGAGTCDRRETRREALPAGPPVAAPGADAAAAAVDPAAAAVDAGAAPGSRADARAEPLPRSRGRGGAALRHARAERAERTASATSATACRRRRRRRRAGEVDAAEFGTTEREDWENGTERDDFDGIRETAVGRRAASGERRRRSSGRERGAGAELAAGPPARAGAGHAAVAPRTARRCRC